MVVVAVVRQEVVEATQTSHPEVVEVEVWEPGRIYHFQRIMLTRLI